MEDVYRWIDAHREEIVSEFFALLRQPGISALNQGLPEAAAETLRIVRDSGFPADLKPVRGGPDIVFSHVDEAAPLTLLCYAHYDVQPVTPLELWESPPFEPTIRHGVIYARGATDNKAGIMAFVKAAQAFRAVRGHVPVNLKMVFEGEEEVGSPHFLDWVKDNTTLLQCDASLCMDGPADHSTKRPAVQLGCKAILYVELALKMNEHDVWSGYAGWVPSPVWRMIKLLNTMIDVDTGRILVDGWYDDLAPVTQDDEELLDRLFQQFNEAEAQKELGITHWAWGMDAREALRRRHYGPTMNICGIGAGYTDEGTKTIIPAEIRVKLDFRCPPYLEPAVQFDKLQAHLKKHGFDDVELILHTARPNPYKISPREPIAQAVIRAADKVFGGVPTVYGVSTQGLIRVYVPHPAVMTGFADPDCRLHAPNENMPVERYFKGIKYAATIMDEFARTKGAS
jgi:acetylornithine deacetylase/succinyl-diaminopimelate desuccinylase-like protein